MGSHSGSVGREKVMKITLRMTAKGTKTRVELGLTPCSFMGKLTLT